MILNRLISTLSLICISMALFAQAPVNDFCTDAIIFSVGDVVNGSSTNATSDAAIASTCGSNPTDDGSLGVWYKVIGTDETIKIDLCGSGYDTGIGVYTGSCVSGLNCVAGNDDGADCGTRAYIEFNSVLDEEYFILVDGYRASTGSFTFTSTGVPTLPPPANDLCNDAEQLTVFEIGSGIATDGTNVSATTHTTVVDCDQYGTINDVWYSFNSGPNTQVSVDIQLVDTDDVGPNIAAGFIYFEIYENCGEQDLGYCGSDGVSSINVSPNTNYLLQFWNSANDVGTFTVLMNNGPNTPATVSSSTVEISRYSANGDLVETVTATDAEGHDQLFSISTGNDEGIFAIDAISGEISIVDEPTLLSSVTTSFVLDILAIDQGPLNPTVSSSGITTINIIDNEFPSILSEDISMDENTANTTSVVTVTSDDADGDNLFFAIIGGNTNNAFAIDGMGEITVNDVNELNFEVNPVFELEVEVVDDGPLTLSNTAMINISLNDLNEVPVISTGGSLNMSQYNGNGYSLGLIEFTDEDINQTHAFAITAGNTDNIFSVDALTGEVTIVNETDLLANGATTYVVTLEVTDDGSSPETGTADFTINVFDNNAPVIDVITFDIDENSTNGTTIGTVTSTDTEGNNITYFIDQGNDNNAFSITAGGDLQINDQSLFDFESTSTFDLLIEAQDDGPGLISGFETITINVNNVNESPILNASSFNISYNSANGYSIGIAEASDPENDALTYSIISGNDDGIFAIDAVSGEITVADGSLLNPATQPIHSLVFQAADAAFSPTNSVTINVFGNEYPIVTTSAFSVDENSAQSTVIGMVAFDDIDGIQLFEITEGNDNGQFAIDGTTGELTVNTASEFDYEATQQFDITVKITDNGLGNLENTGTLAISINDVNEFAPVTSSSDTNIDENTANGTMVTTIIATDDDIFQTLSYVISSGNTSSAFAIDASGQITVSDASALDFETTPTFSLTVDVSDDGSPAITTQEVLTIGLNNINDAPIVSSTNVNLDENSVDGASVTTVVASDEDAGQTLSYMISAGNISSAFAIDASGQITVNDASVLDFETTPTFSLTVDVSDDGSPAITTQEVLTIDLNDLNDAPIVSSTNVNLDENSVDGASVTTVVASDEDAGQTLSYVISAGNTGSAFVIDASGQITVNDATALDFETTPTFSLTVDVSDDGSPSITTQEVLTIGLNDLNEAPVLSNPISDQMATQMQPFSFTVNGNTFIDVDAGDTFTYVATLSDGSALPSWLSFDASAITFSGTPSFTDNTITVSLSATDQGDLSINDDFAIDITVVTGLDIIGIQSVKTFPNPVQSNLTIQLTDSFIGDLQVRLMDVNGKIWKVAQYSKESIEMNLNIDISLLPKGIFMLELKSHESVSINRILKK